MPRQGSGFLYLVNALPITQGFINYTKKAALSDAETKGHLQQLLKENIKNFKPPVGLPPHRHIEHSIELNEGSHPLSVRPYRNSYDQKMR